ncbi:hypothetical protein, partial [Immundisolibacter sp.]|uniref:hypothetical protein n=1 Tax=Immundisolibacter sp. TaxID=1934948 RepID=UPI00260AC9CE
GLRVTKAFCGQSWQRAQSCTDLDGKVRLAACLGCPTGARNAKAAAPGEPLPIFQRFTVSARVPETVPLEVERKRRSRVAR